MSRYYVLSLDGQPISEHATIEDAARVIATSGAQALWSLARKGRAGRPVGISGDERARADKIRFPSARTPPNAS